MMANPYLDIDELKNHYDERQLGILGNDNDTEAINVGRIDSLLDDSAEQVETDLAGAYAAPILNSGGTAPRTIKRMVAVLTMARLYGRRGDLPKWVQSDQDWYEREVDELVSRRKAFPDVGYRNGPKLELPTPPRDKNTIVDNTNFMSYGGQQET